jgi:Co/Zn/Cd efflux system component
MSRRHRHDRQRDEYGQRWEMAAALWDGPRTLDEIVEHFRSYVRFLGLFSVTERLERHDRAVRMVAFVTETLEDLIERGWVVPQGEHYALTELGRKEANTVLSELRETGALLRRFVQPQTVSQVSLGVHLALAALKLPAGLLSGSVGLINDATDTLLDGLSSLLVYAGLRFDKEGAANVVLVLLMLFTGSFTSYEAVRRFFVPLQPEVDWFTFLAAILSALICLILYAYQRFVGLRSGSMALITQSVDSRNHVIVAASVTAGLVASLLRFPLLDTLVGLAVALLILKSAVELAIETVRSLGEEEVDLSRYKFGVVERYERFRQAQLRDWMLYLVEKRGVQTRSELAAQARQALDFGKIPTLRALGLAQQQPWASEMIEQSVAELFEHGWLVGDERLSVTDTGREHLSRGMRGTHRDMHRLSAGRGMRGRGPFASAPIDYVWDRHGRRRAGVSTDGEGTRQ